ncbi:hypothetical protein B0T21DRAFT_372354 [Apiosordaria backusii]|uniref:Uncharacterized protein n=1 Tax=Apiosordaria backusii TaxID=314023 RepID=A0AA40AXE8_9PEZI|nr:hypothetical protein B0T21DRAFT_372354 [Apiosordaria backusii]
METLVGPCAGWSKRNHGAVSFWFVFVFCTIISDTTLAAYCCEYVRFLPTFGPKTGGKEFAGLWPAILTLCVGFVGTYGTCK